MAKVKKVVSRTESKLATRTSPDQNDLSMPSAVTDPISDPAHDPMRQRITLSARAIFDRYGILRVTMEEIARELGISKKTLYKHFANKEELLKAVVYLHMQEAGARMDSMMAEVHKNFLERLQRLIEVISIQAMSVSPQFMSELAPFSPELWTEVENFRAQRLMKFGSLLSQGAREGYIRADVDVELVVLLFMSMIQSMVNPAAVARSHYSFAQLLDGILTIIFEGVLTSEGRKGIHVAGKIKGPRVLRPETLAMMLSPSLQQVFSQQSLSRESVSQSLPSPISSSRGPLKQKISRETVASNNPKSLSPKGKHSIQ